MKQVYMFFGLLLLTGCQSVSLEYRQDAYAVPPVGSTLQLHKELVVPPGKVSVLIQDGAVTPSFWRVDQYRPHCDFELKSKRETERHITPQTFTIIRALRDQENVMRDKPVRVAAQRHMSGIISAKTGSGDVAPPLENNMLIMYLSAESDIDVLRMTCQEWIEPATDNPISIEGIRATLGELFTLREPATKAP